jgi:hypothetical protein
MFNNSADKIAADLAKARTELTEAVVDLENYLKPKQVASRGVQKVTDFFLDEKGQIKPERAAIAGAALLGIIGLLTRDKSRD